MLIFSSHFLISCYLLTSTGRFEGGLGFSWIFDQLFLNTSLIHLQFQEFLQSWSSSAWSWSSWWSGCVEGALPGKRLWWHAFCVQTGWQIYITIFQIWITSFRQIYITSCWQNLILRFRKYILLLQVFFKSMNDKFQIKNISFWKIWKEYSYHAVRQPYMIDLTKHLLKKKNISHYKELQ